eukprot:1137844-Pelagomonas_calceolata.AAC.7
MLIVAPVLWQGKHSRSTSLGNQKLDVTHSATIAHPPKLCTPAAIVVVRHSSPARYPSKSGLPLLVDKQVCQCLWRVSACARAWMSCWQRQTTLSRQPTSHRCVTGANLHGHISPLPTGAKLHGHISPLPTGVSQMVESLPGAAVPLASPKTGG